MAAPLTVSEQQLRNIGSLPVTAGARRPTRERDVALH